MENCIIMENIEHLEDSDNSFTNIDEEIVPDKVNGLINHKHGLSAIEELSAIPNYKDMETLKSNSLELSKQLKSKLVDVKNHQSFLSLSDIEEFLNIENYIKAVGEQEGNNESSTEICMDIDYLENIRKQNELMVRLLGQITLLQWEVEQGYGKIKEREIRAASVNEKCDLETTGYFKSNECSCLII